MEPKHFLRILVARRWMVLAIFLATFGAVLLFTLGQTPMYRAGAAYVVKPTIPEPDSRTLTSAIEVLSRGQVGQTVAEVATSQVIRAQAAETLGLSSAQLREVSVTSRMVPGTNVVEITVEGPYPALVRDFASAVGAHTASFAQGLYGVYALEPLREPTLPSSPEKPRTMLNLLLGALAGLALGVTLVYLLAYLQLPSEEVKPEATPIPGKTAKPAPVAPVAGATTTPAAQRGKRVRADASGAMALPPCEKLSVAMGGEAADDAEAGQASGGRRHLTGRRESTGSPTIGSIPTAVSSGGATSAWPES